MILEFAEKGSLAKVLQNETLPLPQQVSILQNIANGMEFLHSKNVIHRDLKCDNILLDKVLAVK